MLVYFFPDPQLLLLKKFKFIEKLQKTTLETAEDRVGMNMDKKIVDKDLSAEDKAETATVACQLLSIHTFQFS